ncbi:MAG: ABC transporter ATP-binding protein [bacterium]|nr:ABC transporter ATP-binding protein [bacterium]
MTTPNGGRSYRPVHKATPGKPFRTFLSYNRPYWKDYLAGGLLAVVFVGVEMGLPLVISLVVRMLQEGRMTFGYLWICFFVLLGVAATTGFARYWQRMFMIGASRKFEYDIRNDYFRHVQLLSRDFFHRFKTGDVMARATNDLNYVRLFIGPGVMGTVDMIRLPVTLGLMVYFSPPLTLFALMPLPVVSLLVYFFVMYMHRQSKRVQDQFSVVTARAQENLAGARVVKAYGAAEREQRDFRAESAHYMRESIKLSVVMALTWPLIGLVMGAAILLVMWRGGTMVIDGALQFWDLSGFIVCLLMLTWPIAQFGWILTLYQRGAVGMNRILEIFAEDPTIRDDEHTRHDITSLKGGIRFDDVTFAYADRPVLHGISFAVDPGQTVAIVGPTGSGKSTLVSLLTREYDPASGRVWLDEVDARYVPLQVVRQSIGYVPQDTFLFSDTVRENITFGRPGAAQTDIVAAAEVAQFTETVADMPNGYDTLLGERGVNLSGGQKQRLTIARAVIRDPNVLILDDALSSVDTHTEEEILLRLKEFMTARTSVIISHRISTVRHADLILVLKEGQIVERGIHDDLVRERGLYAEMYERQRLEDALEEEQ